MIKKLYAFICAFALVSSFMPSTAMAYEYELTGWRGVSFNNLTKGVDCDLYVDTKNAYEGKACLYIKYNKGYMANTYMHIMLGGTAPLSSKQYKLSYWHKGNNASSGSAKWKWEWTNINDGQFGAITSEWTYNEMLFYPSSDSMQLNLIVEKSLGDYWIDNIRLEEVDGDGTNLITNGDFESCPTDKPENVTDARVVAGNRRLTLKWNNPETEFYNTRVYELNDDGGEELILETEDNTQTELRVDGLVNGKLSKYKICTVSKYNVEADGVLVFGVPESDAVSVSNVSTRNVRNFRFVQADIINSSVGDGAEITIVASAYVDGKMVDYKSQTNILNNGDIKNCLLSFTDLPAEAKIEIYLINNLTDYMPLASVAYSEN